jgi:hypothetical protein
MMAIMVFCTLLVMLPAFEVKTHMTRPQEKVLAGFVAVFWFGILRRRKKRSRHISKATRRAVIERDLKGEAFDPQKHHVDHVWPFSRGGSHTTDNLRVIEKKTNLRKGAKRPQMREMW